jgi:hypothetical protein
MSKKIITATFAKDSITASNHLYIKDLFQTTQSFCNVGHKIIPDRQCLEISVL